VNPCLGWLASCALSLDDEIAESNVYYFIMAVVAAFALAVGFSLTGSVLRALGGSFSDRFGAQR
jgi:nitrate/nitrite transporter NarK